MNIQDHLTGISLACIFLFCMSTILIKMFRVPKQIASSAARAKHSVGALKRILVPTLGRDYTERAVELACRLGLEQKALIILVYVLEIFRTMPLDAPLQKAEEKAMDSLERARSIVNMHGLQVEVKIERARESAEGIIRAARDFDVDLIVIGVHQDFPSIVLSHTVESILKNAPCEVIIDKVAGEGIPA
jgi:nucleotide-binding universal stress UspA family protein